MKHLYLLLGILLSLPLPAQFLPFQGKVFDANDQPLTGQHAFQFSITDGGVNWTETHPAVTVYQGIYAVVLGSQTPLPDGVFANSAMHTLQVQMDGAPMADVMIYRPIENDPKLPDELRDGVQWEDIENPPAPSTSPVGSILAFGGANVPAGWLKCDGSAVSRSDYPLLFAAISTRWGAGDGISTFNLPDFRGRFLRGVDEGKGDDPEAEDRVAIHPLGATGDQVGSYQEDSFKSHRHNHTTRTSGSSYQATVFGGHNLNTNLTTSNPSHPTGGAETRPKNAAVYYIIKFE